MLDLESLKDIPSYKAVLKLVLKSQIQFLVEQLGDHGGEECVVLTASTSEGSLSHLGSKRGKQFIDTHTDIKAKFLGFCLRGDVDNKADCEQEANPPHEDQPVISCQFNQRQTGFVAKKRKVTHNGREGKRPESVTTSVDSSQVVSNDVTVTGNGMDFSDNQSGMYDEELPRSSYQGKDKDNGLCPSDRFGQFKMDQLVSDIGIPSQQVIHDLTDEDVNEECDTPLPALSSSPVDNEVNTFVGTEALDKWASNFDKTSRLDFSIANQHDQEDLQSTTTNNTNSGNEIGPLSAAIKEELSDDSQPCSVGVLSAAIKEEPSNDSQSCSIDDSYQTDKGSYMCDVCFRVFNRKYNMQQHRQLHFGIKQFICPTCNKRFTRQDRLKIHNLRYHSGLDLGMKF